MFQLLPACNPQLASRLCLLKSNQRCWIFFPSSLVKGYQEPPCPLDLLPEIHKSQPPLPLLIITWEKFRFPFGVGAGEGWIRREGEKQQLLGNTACAPGTAGSFIYVLGSTPHPQGGFCYYHFADEETPKTKTQAGRLTDTSAELGFEPRSLVT